MPDLYFKLQAQQAPLSQPLVIDTSSLTKTEARRADELRAAEQKTHAGNRW